MFKVVNEDKVKLTVVRSFANMLFRPNGEVHYIGG